MYEESTRGTFFVEKILALYAENIMSEMREVYWNLQSFIVAHGLISVEKK